MKKVVFYIGVLALLTISCDKEEVKEVINNETEVNNGTSDEKFKCVYTNSQGNIMGTDQVDFSLPDYVVFVESVDENTRTINARYFFTEEEAYNFSLESDGYESFPKKVEQVREIRALAQLTGDDQLGIDESDVYSTEMQELLRNIEVENGVNNDRGVGILHDGPSGNGSVAPLTGSPQPSLFWFRNRAESASGVGLGNWLWKKRWFTGGSAVSYTHLTLPTTPYV